MNTETPKTPVLLIIFNRPDKVRALINALSATRPERIYVSADGPRAHVPEDKEKCESARQAAQNIPWPCEVLTNFSPVNLGVDKGMEAAMSWFFSEVEEGIICEDDCIPNRDFMEFSSELLRKYRDDRKVMLVCGTNFQDGIKRGEASYYFSNYPVWGYAMWRRTWQAFDSKLDGLENFLREGKIDRILTDRKQRAFWIGFFKKIRRGKFNFTDTRLMFSIWNAGGVCVIPQVNLIKNIGFDADATHPTIGSGLSMESESMGTIVHPRAVEVDRGADDYFFKKIHDTNLIKRILNKAKIFLRR